MTTTTPARLSPALLEAAGRALCGEDWQRPLARSLGAFHPDGARPSIDDRLVRRWIAGERDIPEWVPHALIKMLNVRADRASKIADKIRAATSS